MPKTLVVAESPAKAKTIEKYLGGDFAVRASYGHIRDLPKSQLGVDVERDFAPEYIVPEDSARHVRELKTALKRAEDLVLATDYDREGEAIAFHVATLLGVSPEEAKRVTFTEITRDAILEAFQQPREIDMKLVDAQQARRILARLVEIPEGRLAASPDKKGIQLAAEPDAQGHVERLNRAAYRVVKVEQKERKRSPAPPFTTSTLQQEAARKLGFGARKTMTLAQRLYEGIDLPGEGTVGLITYMRTDSVNIAD